MWEGKIPVSFILSHDELQQAGGGVPGPGGTSGLPEPVFVSTEHHLDHKMQQRKYCSAADMLYYAQEPIKKFLIATMHDSTSKPKIFILVLHVNVCFLPNGTES